MNDIMRALEIAIKAHGHDIGKDGHLYVMHPIQVAQNLNDETHKIVALLHDVVEDTDWTLADIKSAGFSDEIVAAVDAITHRPRESRADYINRCKENEIACAVKLADLMHNSDIRRLSIITLRDVRRTERYQHDIAKLLDMPEYKTQDGLFEWKYFGFKITQSATKNPNGTHGLAMNYIILDGNTVIAIKTSLAEAVMHIRSIEI